MASQNVCPKCGIKETYLESYKPDSNYLCVKCKYPLPSERTQNSAFERGRQRALNKIQNKTACEMRIKTPRGTFNIHTKFDTIEEARQEGWGLWFQHENYLILARDNRIGAVVEK